MDIIDSIGQLLPTIEVHNDADPYPSVSAAASTYDQEPALGWINAGPADMFARTATALANHQRPAGGAAAAAYAPAFDQTHILLKEGDVVRATDVYLLNAVNLALLALHPQLRGRLLCCSEQTQGVARPDVVWSYRSSPLGAAVPVAVLELKTVFMLQGAEFRKARLRDDNAAREAAANPPVENDGSLFAGNSNLLMRQAQKYAFYFAVDVALFDWRSMFVADFATLDEVTGALEGAWFVERAAGGETFRSLLLGFLLRALRRHGIIVCIHTLACFFRIRRRGVVSADRWKRI